MGVTVPFRFQLQDVRQMHRWNGRVLYAAEPGLGKSFCSLLYAYRHPQIRPIVVVCPATIKYLWQNQALQHIGMESIVLEGTNPQKMEVYRDYPLYILNYDILGRTKNGTGWLDWLRSKHPQLVIIDECFPYETRVLTDHGWLAIGDIVRGRLAVKVYSRNNDGQISTQNISNYIEIPRTQRMVTIHHSEGELSCTANHNIWTGNKGYVKALELTKNDILCVLQQSKWQKSNLLEGQNNKQSLLTTIARVDRVNIREEQSTLHDGNRLNPVVFCLEVEENHNFFADGVLVSNCHYISEPRSIRSKAVEQLCKGVPHVLGLSGTPLTNRPIELWHPLHIIKPTLFPSRWKYAQEFCSLKKTYWGWDFSGASNLDVLNEILVDPDHGAMIRRRKQDVLSQLPAKQLTVVPIEIADRAQYKKALNFFVEWLREHMPDKTRTALKAQAVTHLGYLRRLVGVLKIRSIINWLDDFLVESEDEKVIVFTNHKAPIGSLQQQYKERCVVVDGSVVGKERTHNIERFLNDRSIRVFLGNIDAAGTGWSATGVSTVVFAELPWVPGKIDQCIDRTHGLNRGQKDKHSQAFFLIGRNTIEEKLLEILQNKSRIISAVLDGEETIGSLDVFDLLIREIRKEGNAS